MDEARIDRILRAFDETPGRYRRAEVDEALALREELAPRLLDILEEVAANQKPFAGDRGRQTHAYALLLLSNWREPRAYHPVVRAFMLDDETLEDVWSDFVDTLLPVALHRTCGGDLDALGALALDRMAHHHVRVAALDALNRALLLDGADRGRVIDIYRKVFDDARSVQDAYGLCTLAVGSVSEIHPVELRQCMEEMFRDGMVEEFFFTRRDTLALLDEDREAVLERERTMLEEQERQGIHAFEESFGWLDPSPAQPPEWPAPRTTPVASVSARGIAPPADQPRPAAGPGWSETKADRAKKKAKKKAAAKSRKQNRRR